MMPMPLVSNGLKYLLEIWYLRHTGTAEKVLGDTVFGKTPLAQIEVHPAVLGHHATEGKGRRRNSTCIAAIGTIHTFSVGKNGMISDASLPGHHTLSR